MADPIVFDCGGSTRIKRIEARGVGNLGTILDVDQLTGPGAVVLQPGTGPLPPVSTGSQQLVNPGAATPFRGLSIMFQDSAGVPFTIPVAGLPNFLIESDQGQSVRGDFAGGNLIVTVFSPDDDPIIAAKQLRRGAKKQRRYIIENAGGIRKITLNDTPPPVFDATNPAAAPVAPGAVGPGGAVPQAGLPLYVSVVVS